MSRESACRGCGIKERKRWTNLDFNQTCKGCLDKQDNEVKETRCIRCDEFPFLESYEKICKWCLGEETPSPQTLSKKEVALNAFRHAEDRAKVQRQHALNAKKLLRHPLAEAGTVNSKLKPKASLHFKFVNVIKLEQSEFGELDQAQGSSPITLRMVYPAAYEQIKLDAFNLFYEAKELVGRCQILHMVKLTSKKIECVEMREVSFPRGYEDFIGYLHNKKNCYLGVELVASLAG